MLHNTYIICHYAEIGIKSGNRNYFEKKLVKNIKERLDKELPGSFENALPRTGLRPSAWVRRISGRILVKLSPSVEKIKNPPLVPSRSSDGTGSFEKGEDLTQILRNIFGIANFSFAIESKQDIKILKKDCWDLIKDKKFKTFRVTARRSQKNFPMTSEEINKEVGAYIVKKLSSPTSLSPSRGRGIKGEGMSRGLVSLKNPEINCFVEIVDGRAFVYPEKIKGPGGMPVGANGKALVLLSGGIDSPVAAYYALKRGVRAGFVHFHSMPYATPASIEKVKDIAKTLGKFQIRSKIFLVPFAGIQKEIVLKTPEKLRVILYRRLMLRIAEKLAQDNKYLALYTGESVGQVASQTLENIRATEDAINLPILRPLIGFDKEDIIEKAKEIGTYEISILPHEDCCTRFIPKHPETKADLKEVQKAEKKLDVKKMVEEAIEKIEIERMG